MAYNEAQGNQVNSTRSAFSAYVNTTTTNTTGAGETVTVIFNTKAVDQNTNYSTSTGLFTAPVTGIYEFCWTIGLTGIISTHTSGLIQLVTTPFSNIQVWRGNPFAQFQTAGAFFISGSIILPLTATNTASMVVTISNGTQVVGFEGGAGGAAASFFSGFQLA
jgi:hypothetical protein